VTRFGGASNSDLRASNFPCRSGSYVINSSGRALADLGKVMKELWLSRCVLPLVLAFAVGLAACSQRSDCASRNVHDTVLGIAKENLMKIITNQEVVRQNPGNAEIFQMGILLSMGSFAQMLEAGDLKDKERGRALAKQFGQNRAPSEVLSQAMLSLENVVTSDYAANIEKYQCAATLKIEMDRASPAIGKAIGNVAIKFKVQPNMSDKSQPVVELFF
jgi:hypothetical protein